LSKRAPKLGQNFLSDQHIARQIVDTLGDISQATVIEIGPGKGVLTQHLAGRAQRLILVELDRDLGPQLANKYSDDASVEVVQADALKVEFAALLNGEPTPAKLIGNLPYYITSDLLLKFFSLHELFSELVVMVQLEVAERICAVSGTRDYGVLSVTSQLYCDCRMILKVPPEAFTPRPKVHSAVVRLKVNPKTKRLHVDEVGFLSFAKKCFAQKRKTLMNNLREVYPQDLVERTLSLLSLRADVRAEAIPFEQLCEIYRSLNVLAGA